LWIRHHILDLRVHGSRSGSAARTFEYNAAGHGFGHPSFWRHGNQIRRGQRTDVIGYHTDDVWLGFGDDEINRLDTGFLPQQAVDDDFMGRLRHGGAVRCPQFPGHRNPGDRPPLSNLGNLADDRRTLVVRFIGKHSRTRRIAQRRRQRIGENEPGRVFQSLNGEHENDVRRIGERRLDPVVL